MTGPDNEAILTIGYAVDRGATPTHNARRRRSLRVTEFTIPGTEGTHPTEFGDITVLYVARNEQDQPVKVGLQGNLLKGKGHGRRHGHRKPFFEDQVEVQLGDYPRLGVCRGAQSLSKRETIFVSAGRANS